MTKYLKRLLDFAGNYAKPSNYAASLIFFMDTLTWWGTWHSVFFLIAGFVFLWNGMLAPDWPRKR